MNITIETNLSPSAGEVVALLNQSSWASNRTLEDLELMLRNSNCFVSIQTKGKLIGFARAITDGIYRALIDDVIVDINFRKLGLGNILSDNLLNELSKVEEVVLLANNTLESFYDKLSFKVIKESPLQ